MDDIVVGVDQSATARHAAVRAAELAQAYDANLHLVMCVNRGSNVEVNVGGDHFRSDVVAEADHQLSVISRHLPCDRTTSTVDFGDPVRVLCDEAIRLDARAIVVGNRRVQGAGRILGSVAGGVTKHAPCDVVVANTCN